MAHLLTIKRKHSSKIQFLSTGAINFTLDDLHSRHGFNSPLQNHIDLLVEQSSFPLSWYRVCILLLEIFPIN